MYLQVVATLVLGLAGILTLMLGATTSFFTARAPTGQNAMGLIVVIIGMAARWALLLIAALICAGLGRFDWISPRGGFPTLIVIISTIGLGVVFTLSWFQWMELKKGPFTALIGNAGAIVLPALVYIYLLAAIWNGRTQPHAEHWQRLAAYPLGLLGAIGFVAGLTLFIIVQMKKMRRENEAYLAQQSRYEEIRRDNAERVARDAAELAALSDAAPLESFIPHLFITKTEAHQAETLKRIARLPNLTAQFERAMSHPDALQREYASHAMRRLEKVDPTWAPMIRRAMASLAAETRTAPALYDAPTQRTYKGMIWGMLEAAQRFPAERFDTELAAIRAAVMIKPKDDVRADILSLLDKHARGEKI